MRWRKEGKGGRRNRETGIDTYSLTDPLDKIGSYENIWHSTGKSA